MIESTPVLVIKNDGSRQVFDAQKIKRGIIKACEKRPVTMNQIDELVSSIEKQISNSLDQEVKSSAIGEMVMERLKKLDEISYVRFAAVYRKFKDITTFITFLNSVS
jgi:transcriptional repressor NrdR